MVPEEKDAAPVAASASGRRRGQRKLLGWGTVFCFGSRRREEALAEEGTPRERSRRSKRRRTVPVDGELLSGTVDRDVVWRGADDKESRKGLRLQGCCFLAPARSPGHKSQHSSMDSGSGRSTTHNKQRPLEHKEQQAPPRSPSDDAPAPSRIQATGGSRSRRAQRPRGDSGETRARTTRPCDSNGESGKGEASAREPCPNASPGAGHASFGPVVGLCVVTAVSMAGLLGGRLWAVACVCAWLAALSKLREARAAGSGMAGSDGGDEAAVVHVGSASTDHKKLVVLRGLLERDRAKVVMIP